MANTRMLTVADLKQHVSPAVYGSALDVQALQRVIDTCEADVLLHCGHHSGVVFGNPLLQLRVRANSSGSWLAAGDVPDGNPQVSGTAVMVQAIDWEEPSGNLAYRITMEGRNMPGSDSQTLSSLFGGNGRASNRTLYVLYNDELIQNESDTINTDSSTGQTVVWEHLNSDSHAVAVASRLDDVEEDDILDIILADAGAHVPYNVAQQKAYRQNAIIELAKVRLAFNALQSYGEGGYNQASLDTEKARKRILSELTDLVKQPFGPRLY